MSETDIPQYRDVGTINRLRDQKTESPSSTHPWIRAGARLVSATRGKDQAPASLHKPHLSRNAGSVQNGHFQGTLSILGSLLQLTL